MEQEHVRDLIARVVRKEDDVPIGTACAIAPHHWLTAQHVLRNNDLTPRDVYLVVTKKEIPSQIKARYTVVDHHESGRHELMDVWLLQTEEATFCENCLRISSAPLSEGLSKIIVCAYPGSDWNEGLNIKEGAITARYQEETNYPLWRSDCLAEPGNSGAPLILNGSVAGIVLTRKNTNNELYCLSLCEIRSWLEDLIGIRCNAPSRVLLGFGLPTDLWSETNLHHYRDMILEHWKEEILYAAEGSRELEQLRAISKKENKDDIQTYFTSQLGLCVESAHSDGAYASTVFLEWVRAAGRRKKRGGFKDIWSFLVCICPLAIHSDCQDIDAMCRAVFRENGIGIEAEIRIAELAVARATGRFAQVNQVQVGNGNPRVDTPLVIPLECHATEPVSLKPSLKRQLLESLGLDISQDYCSDDVLSLFESRWRVDRGKAFVLEGCYESEVLSVLNEYRPTVLARWYTDEDMARRMDPHLIHDQILQMAANCQNRKGTVL